MIGKDQPSKYQLFDKGTDEENKNVRPAKGNSFSLKDEMEAALDQKKVALRNRPATSSEDDNQNDGSAGRSDNRSVSWP